MANHPRCRARRVVVLLAAIGLGLSVAAVAGQVDRRGRRASLVLVGGRVLQPDGTLQGDVAVVIRGGRIRRVMPAAKATGGGPASGPSAEAPAVRRFCPNTVIAPGLVELFSAAGTAGQALDSVPLVDPGAGAIEALDPTAREFAAALRSGVTAVMVVPAPQNLVGGVAATVRTWVENGRLDVLRDDGPMVFALGEGVWRPDRPPTSRAGAIDRLRRLVQEAREGKADARVQAALAGELDGIVHCREAADVDSLRSVLGDAARRWAIAHSADAVELAPDLAGWPAPVVVGPYRFASSRRTLLGAAALADAGVHVAFAGGSWESPADSLRTTAALAVRHGLDPAAARRAMTIEPARVAGVADRIGSIAPKRDADLVVFSGDPLRLDSVVREVYVRGVRVYAAADGNSGRTAVRGSTARPPRPGEVTRE